MQAQFAYVVLNLSIITLHVIELNRFDQKNRYFLSVCEQDNTSKRTESLICEGMGQVLLKYYLPSLIK